MIARKAKLPMGWIHRPRNTSSVANPMTARTTNTTVVPISSTFGVRCRARVTTLDSTLTASATEMATRNDTAPVRIQ